MEDLGSVSTEFVLLGPAVIACDNKACRAAKACCAALALCKDSKEKQRAEPIDTMHCYLRNHVESGEPAFVYCEPESNLSDCSTKA
jgi:hypothetical protein